MSNDQRSIIGNKEFETYIDDYIKLREKHKDNWFDQYFKLALDSQNKKARVKQYLKRIGKEELCDNVIALTRKYK